MIPLRPGYALREYRSDDAAQLAKHADNPNVARHLRSHFPQPYTYSNAVDWIRHVRSDETNRILAITFDDNVIGNIGVYPGSDVYAHTAELGYWLSEEHWGRGVASQAVRAMCRIAFSDPALQRIFACVFEPNRGSARVLEKNGFVLEGTLRAHVEKDGQTSDEQFFGLLRSEWQAGAGESPPNP